MNIREHNMLEMWIMAVEKTNYALEWAPGNKNGLIERVTI
jgi:hypothetical protein